MLRTFLWFYCDTCATVSGLCEILIMSSFASVGWWLIRRNHLVFSQNDEQSILNWNINYFFIIMLHCTSLRFFQMVHMTNFWLTSIVWAQLYAPQPSRSSYPTPTEFSSTLMIHQNVAYYTDIWNFDYSQTC